MKRKRIIGLVLLIVGIIVLLVSLAADVVGIGNPAAFGPRQIIGTVAGVILTVVGLFLTLKK